ncbi:DUF6301 family protein [Pseudoclavibacter helvolus]|uniref:DUF6301 family protein n=1 Tax=Pseudoclavibacter helvolus TaxID=255205 RepID=UPI0008382769|nr:DUF6301 family protein [Pseudoclavibacter helvolus]
MSVAGDTKLELIVADTAQVQRIAAAYRDVEWPLSAEREREIASSLGWRLDRQRARGASYYSGMLDAAGGHSDVGVSSSDGNVSEVRVNLCNFSREHSSEDILAVRKSMTECVETVLGKPSGKRRGNAFWDLESRGRIWVESIDYTVLLHVLQPRSANIERAEERLGIPDDRIPGTSDESDYL